MIYNNNLFLNIFYSLYIIIYINNINFFYLNIIILCILKRYLLIKYKLKDIKKVLFCNLEYKSVYLKINYYSYFKKKYLKNIYIL